MKKRCMALLLCFVMIAGLFVNVPMVAKATVSNGEITDITADDAIRWCESVVGKHVGYNDGSNEYQCSELIQAYMEYLQYGTYYNSQAKLGATAFTNANNAPNWISVLQGVAPQKGDILVYCNGGHVAIYGNEETTYHQNYDKKNYVSKEGNYLTSKYASQTYWGVWRPKFNRGITFWGLDDGVTLSEKVKVWAKRFDNDSNHYARIYLDNTLISGHHSADENGFFSFEINTREYSNGEHTLKIEYANTSSGWTDSRKVIFKNTESDTTKPVVTNMKIYNVSNKGYSVSCTVSDNIGVTQVKFPTWLPSYSEADIKWLNGTLNGNTATCYVRASDFTNESVKFTTDARAYDAAGNVSDYARGEVFIDQDKPVASNMKIYNISREGYSVSCTVSDNVGVTKVLFPTWIDSYSEEEIHWIEGSLNGNTATAYIKTADFTSESTNFTTDARACDAAGNVSDYARVIEFIDQNAPQISDIQITDENEEGYTISCKVTDDYSGVSKVCFLTQLTDADAASGWQNDANTQGTMEGDRYFFKVPFEDYDYENGKYTTTIYACDGFGNEKSIKYSHDVYGEIPEEDIPAGQPVSKGLWIAGVSPQTYTGKAIKPAVRVYDNNRLLVEKRDYSISYKNNVKANDASNEKAAPTITVTGKGNYTGKDSVTFSIMQKNIADADVSADNLILKANGKVQKPIPTLTYNGKKLVNKKDFTVTFPDVRDGAYKENGTYSVRISGIGNYTGSREVTVTVTGAKMASKLTVGSIGKQLYTGEPIEPSLVVKDEKKVLKQGEDYTVSFENNKEVGTATATVAGIGNYAGTKKVTFKIVANASISSAQITMTTADGWNFVGSTYTGNEIRPDQYMVNVTIKGKENQTKTVTLKEGTDYTVSYQNNVNAGTATMLFKGINGYSGSQKKTYRITAFDMRGTGQDDPGVDVVLNGTYTYAKAGCMAKPTVLFGGSPLKEGRDYSLSYKNIAKVNDGSDQKKLPTVVIKGKGNFKGSIEKTYQIAAEDLGNMTLTAKDIVWKNKAGIFKTRVVIKDQTGKTLNAGKDYETKLAYTYENDTALKEDVIRRAGEEVQAKDILPAGTIIRVTASAKKGGGYQGTVSGTYRITSSDINKAVVKIPAQVYTGKAVKVDNVMQITMNGKPLSTDNYEIVSYSNNRNKGTASVTIKGKNDCGGIRTVKFKIKSKGFLWWWRS